MAHSASNRFGTLLQRPHAGVAPALRPAAAACVAALDECARRPSPDISWASTTVDRRCAMTSVVLFCATLCQFGLDGALVGGVQRRGGFVKDQDGRVFQQGAGNGHALLLAARELEARAHPPWWRSPAGVAAMKAWMWAACAAACTCSQRGTGLGRRQCCTATVSLNSTVSCGTMPIAWRTLAWVTFLMSCPAIRMRPAPTPGSATPSDDRGGCMPTS
jgi:hypothetical protein